MPEPPKISSGGEDQYWKRRPDGPSTVGINGYRTTNMRWFNVKGELLRVVFFGSYGDRGNPHAQVYSGNDPKAPSWAHWELGVLPSKESARASIS